MKTTKFKIDGMHCDGCVKRVRGALEKTPGVVSSEVIVGAATVGYDESKTTPTVVTQNLEKLGFDVTEMQS